MLAAPVPTPRPARDPRVLDELLTDGSMILFHTASRVLMTLNPTAALVWDSCDGEHDEPAIVATLESLFPQAGSLTADVRAILSDLRSRGMLRVDAIPAGD